MRVISGIYKGFRFNPPKKFSSRPTTDQAKEALFNILNNQYYFDEISVLDLFSGTGSIGIEFASRSCTKIDSVEKNPRVVKYANEMYRKLNLNYINQIQSDVFNFIDKSSKKYDVIFADPPFNLDNLIELPNLIFENNMLEKDGLLIIEHGKYSDFSQTQKFIEMRNYGGVRFSFFQ